MEQRNLYLIITVIFPGISSRHVSAYGGCDVWGKLKSSKKSGTLSNLTETFLSISILWTNHLNAMNSSKYCHPREIWGFMRNRTWVLWFGFRRAVPSAALWVLHCSKNLFFHSRARIIMKLFFGLYSTFRTLLYVSQRLGKIRSKWSTPHFHKKSWGQHCLMLCGKLWYSSNI